MTLFSKRGNFGVQSLDPVCMAVGPGQSDPDYFNRPKQKCPIIDTFWFQNSEIDSDTSVCRTLTWVTVGSEPDRLVRWHYLVRASRTLNLPDIGVSRTFSAFVRFHSQKRNPKSLAKTIISKKFLFELKF